MAETDRTGAREPAPGDRIAHYVILEKLGEGGMGVVFRARDATLPREVALKRPRSGSEQTDPDRHRRFLREGKAMAALSHPGVVKILEVFEDDGIPWIAMELVEGGSLRSELTQGQPLPWDRIIHYAEDLVDALGAAHREHILHRDIKPGNVLVGRDGRARLVDFGLARHFARAGDVSSMSTQSSEITASGQRPGTVAYMSPEQALGRSLDGRTDIFSLGAVLYEMCTGRQPFAGADQSGVLDAILNREPQAIGRLNYAIPEEFEAIVRKCLSKNAEDRYQDTRDLLVDIRRLRRRAESETHPDSVRVSGRRRVRTRRRGAVMAGLTAAGVVVIAMLALAIWLGDQRPQGELGQDNVRGWYERALRYMEERETEEGLNEAIRLFTRTAETDPTFAKGLADLGNAWWERYRLTGEEVHREEAERAVAGAAELEPDLAEVHHARGYGLWVQGRFEEAKKEFKLAVEADHMMARAWANLGQVCSDLGQYDEGLAALRRAISLRPDHFRYRVRLGVFFDKFSEHRSARQAYRKAIELKPDSWIAWGNLGAAQLRSGAFEEAIPSLLRAAEIEDSADVRSNLGTAYYHLDKLPEAVEHYRLAVELDPDRAVYWANLGDALRENGQEPEAREAYEAAIPLARETAEREPGRPRAHARLGMYCARAGEMDCALTEAEHLDALGSPEADISLSTAVIYCLAGRTRAALDSLERAVRLGITRAQIEKDPDLPRLAVEPRYARILQLAG